MGEAGLVDWYLAVLDEIEETAGRERTRTAALGWDHIAGYADSALVGMFSPDAVLADVAAKRAIVADHKPVEYRGIDGPSCGRCESYMRYPCPTIRLLASAHTDQPGYRPEWLPERTAT